MLGGQIAHSSERRAAGHSMERGSHPIRDRSPDPDEGAKLRRATGESALDATSDLGPIELLLNDRTPPGVDPEEAMNALQCCGPIVTEPIAPNDQETVAIDHAKQILGRSPVQALEGEIRSLDDRLADRPMLATLGDGVKIRGPRPGDRVSRQEDESNVRERCRDPLEGSCPQHGLCVGR